MKVDLSKMEIGIILNLLNDHVDEYGDWDEHGADINEARLHKKFKLLFGDD